MDAEIEKQMLSYEADACQKVVVWLNVQMEYMNNGNGYSPVYPGTPPPPVVAPPCGTPDFTSLFAARSPNSSPVILFPEQPEPAAVEEQPVLQEDPAVEALVPHPPKKKIISDNRSPYYVDRNSPESPNSQSYKFDPIYIALKLSHHELARRMRRESRHTAKEKRRTERREARELRRAAKEEERSQEEVIRLEEDNNCLQEGNLIDGGALGEMFRYDDYWQPETKDEAAAVAAQHIPAQMQDDFLRLHQEVQAVSDQADMRFDYYKELGPYPGAIPFELYPDAVPTGGNNAVVEENKNHDHLNSPFNEVDAGHDNPIDSFSFGNYPAGAFYESAMLMMNSDQVWKNSSV